MSRLRKTLKDSKAVSVFYSESSCVLIDLPIFEHTNMHTPNTENYFVFLTCFTGSCRREYTLDLLSSVALAFLESESTAERARKHSSAQDDHKQEGEL